MIVSEFKYPIFSINAMKKDLLEGKYTVQQLNDYFVENINKNKALHAILHINPISPEQINESQQRYNNKQPRALEGIPIAIKDNILVKDMYNTCASKVLEGFVSNYDATVVENLRKAGAIIFFKTNLDEFAMGSYGNNGAYGGAVSPWKFKGENNNENILAGGSSSGSAVAVASGMCPASLGTETGGSVRLPAAWTGIVGLKPTYGVCSRYGVVTYASSLDVVGTFASSVENCEIVWDSIKSYDKENDATSVPFPENHPMYQENNIRVAILSNIKSSSACVEKAFDEVIDYLKTQHVLVDNIEVPESEYIVPAYCIIAWSEAMSNLMRFDGIRYGKELELTDKSEDTNVIKLNDYYKKTRTEHFGKEVLRRLIAGTMFVSHKYKEIFFDQANIVRQKYIDFFEENWKKYDFFLIPTASTEAISIEKSQNNSKTDEYYTDLKTILANLTGTPAISIPIKVCDHQLPIGLQIIAPAFGEKSLFKFAKKIEEKFNVFKNLEDVIKTPSNK